MNRQTLTIGAVLLTAVVLVLGITVYFARSGSEDRAASITGPGQAAEARGIIAEIEGRRQSGAAAPVRQAVPVLINPSDEEAGQPAGGGAIAITPEPVADAPGGANTELDAAFERARDLQAAGQLDDAQVLFFFGARQGHARSAYAYAEMNDPIHHSPETSLLAKPDAFQAFRWYSVARDGGMDAAVPRLDALHEWAVAAAANGDSGAERLLLQWEQ